MWWLTYPLVISTAVGLSAALVCLLPTKQEKKELEESND